MVAGPIPAPIVKTMNNVLDKLEVLKLNRIHEPIRLETPRIVFGDLTTYLVHKRTGEFVRDAKGNKIVKMMAYDIEFFKNPDGTYDFDKCIKFQLVDWDTWITLPVRSHDLFLRTAHTSIRIPRVVMVMKYSKMPKKKFSLNFNTVYEVYKGVCAYTNRKLKKSEGNMDHKLSRARGGKTAWDNIVWCDKKINAHKGSRLNSECGLPDVDPIIPEEIPMVNFLHNEKGIPEWNLFLKQKE